MVGKRCCCETCPCEVLRDNFARTIPANGWRANWIGDTTDFKSNNAFGGVTVPGGDQIDATASGKRIWTNNVDCARASQSRRARVGFQLFALGNAEVGRLLIGDDSDFWMLEVGYDGSSSLYIFQLWHNVTLKATSNFSFGNIATGRFYTLMLCLPNHVDGLVTGRIWISTVGDPYIPLKTITATNIAVSGHRGGIQSGNDLLVRWHYFQYNVYDTDENFRCIGCGDTSTFSF